MKERRAKILELTNQLGTVPSLRDLADWLKLNGFTISHEAVRTDLKALGLQSR